ncbi:MAG: HEAT repeat domain-containing protein [Gorillibacterium sp.]|nr:HEAT repeat domain-containing protein [Gorillibacterium sp.]
MILEEAIHFLQSNQPLPNDNDLSEQVIKTYDQTRMYFMNNPEIRCVPLFLNSFGEGSEFGVYQLIEDVTTQFPHEGVVQYLIKALQSEHKGVRYWCSQIASSFPNAKLIPPIVKLLEESDSDVRYSAITALAQIDDDRVLSIIKEKRLIETDQEIIDLIEEIIGGLE